MQFLQSKRRFLFYFYYLLSDWLIYLFCKQIFSSLIGQNHLACALIVLKTNLLDANWSKHLFGPNKVTCARNHNKCRQAFWVLTEFHGIFQIRRNAAKNCRHKGCGWLFVEVLSSKLEKNSLWKMLKTAKWNYAQKVLRQSLIPSLKNSFAFLRDYSISKRKSAN